MYERHRFKTDLEDYRPVTFPPPGPYWCTGETDDHSVVVAYLPKGEPLLKWWPDAIEVETVEEEVIFFTDRFPRPTWWAAPDVRSIKPTTLDGIKRLAKAIKRDTGLQHAKALEAAAAQAGYPSFHAARAALAP